MKKIIATPNGSIEVDLSPEEELDFLHRKVVHETILRPMQLAEERLVGLVADKAVKIADITEALAEGANQLVIDDMRADLAAHKALMAEVEAEIAGLKAQL